MITRRVLRQMPAVDAAARATLASAPLAAAVGGLLRAFARARVVAQVLAALPRIHAALLQRGLRLLPLGVAARRVVTATVVLPLARVAGTTTVLLLAARVAVRHALAIGGVFLPHAAAATATTIRTKHADCRAADRFNILSLHWSGRGRSLLPNP